MNNDERLFQAIGSLTAKVDILLSRQATHEAEQKEQHERIAVLEKDKAAAKAVLSLIAAVSGTLGGLAAKLFPLSS